MIGYAILDIDNLLSYRTQDFIENDFPNFFNVNSHLLIKHWKFDTEDNRSMVNMLRTINDLKVPKDSVMNFINSIGYDLGTLKNANKI